MSKKQRIMEKLFDNKQLSNEEILYLGANLVDEGEAVDRKGLPNYDHSIKDSVSKACGLIESDFDAVNELIKSEIMGRNDELNTLSKQIEVYEKIGLSKPQNFRLLMYQFVKMKSSLQKSGGISLKIGRGNGGDKGGFEDFLDFLKGGR